MTSLTWYSIMDSDTRAAGSIYRHNNNLASSILPNISSVGFTKLRKVNTNSSTISAASTATANTTNPLTRLFTRNKSSSSVFNSEGSPFDDVSDSRSSNPALGATNASVTKVNSRSEKSSKLHSGGRDSKFKLRFRGSKDSALLNTNSIDTFDGGLNGTGGSSDTLTTGPDSRPELTIQTTGHLSLKIPKRIVSLSLLDDSSFYGSKKASVSSPVSTFHSLFHRSSASAQPLNDIRIIENEEMSSNSNKIPISLSSNSSNSNVTDQLLASMYNFANPDFTLEDIDTSTGSSLQDLQKKLLTPTDQYLLGRTKGISVSKIGSSGFGIGTAIPTSASSGSHSSNSGLTINSSPSNSIATAFSEIGLGIANDSIPRAGEYSKRSAKFYNRLFTILRPLCYPSQYRKQPNGFQFPFLGLTVEKIAHFVKEGYVQSLPKTNDIDDFQVREMTLDLTLFYSQCLNALKSDSSMPLNFNGYGGQLSIDLLMDCWTKLEFQWTIFVEKIRFYLMLVFQPLQKYFREFSNVRLDSILFATFKDNIVTPFLVQRLSTFHNFQDEERSSLKSNLPLVRNIINCFNMLIAKTLVIDNNPLAATLLLTDTFELLCSIEDSEY